MDQERDAAPAERADIDVGRPAHEREEAPLPFEDRRRARQPLARQHGRENRIARGFGVGDPLPVGQGLRPRLAERDVIVDREINGLLQAVGRKLHQLAGGERDGGQAENRNVPAAGGDIGVEGIDQPAIDLVGQGNRGDELCRARALGLRDREAGRDVVARMPGDAADIGVVEVEIADGGAVGEGRKVGAARRVVPMTVAPPPPMRQRDAAADAHRLLVEGGKAAAERVDDMHLDALDGRLVEVVVAQGVGIGGKTCRERSFARRRDRRCRTIFRPCNSRSDRQDSRASGEMQKLSAWKFHCDLPQLNLRQAEPGPQAALSVSNNRVTYFG